MRLQQQLNKYWIIAIVSAREHLVYRANYLTEVCGMLLWTGFAMLTWWSLYDVNNVSVIHGYDRPTMMLYLYGVGVIVASIHLLKQGDKTVDDIHRGVLNNYLMKPIHPTLYWLTYDLSRKALTSLTVIGVSIIIGISSAPWVHLQFDWIAVLSTVLFLFIAAILNFFLFQLTSLLSFWVGVSWGYSFVLRVTMMIATGGLIPLDLLPPHLQYIFAHAPFQFLGYVPLQTLLGRFTTPQIIAMFEQGLFWIVCFALIGHLIYKKGLKTYGAYGG